MNTISVLGNIFAIFMLTVKLPLLEAIMSAEERQAEFKKLETLRKSVTTLYYPSTSKVINAILSEYILSMEEMVMFFQYLNTTGEIPEWSDSRKLNDYEYYEFLKYEAHLETLPFSMSAANRIIIKLESKIFENSPRIPNDIAYDMYMEKHLYKLLAFDDYYAIMVYLQDESQINLNNPAAWRMKRALYSLAIRQYNPNFIPSYFLQSCYYKEKRTADFANSIYIGFEFEKSTFSICNSKFSESYSYFSAYRIDNSLVWLSCEATITDPAVVVSLEDILDNHNGHLYVLFPEVKIKVLNGPIFHNKKYGQVAGVQILTNPILDKSDWLTALANKIEEYKRMEQFFLENED